MYAMTTAEHRALYEIAPYTHQVLSLANFFRWKFLESNRKSLGPLLVVESLRNLQVMAGRKNKVVNVLIGIQNIYIYL